MNIALRNHLFLTSIFIPVSFLYVHTPTSKRIKKQTVPHYDDFVLIFGKKKKNRANDEGTERLADAIETLNSGERETGSDSHSGFNSV